MTVITCLLTSQPDPQRGTRMKPSMRTIQTLARSLHGKHHLHVIHDQMAERDTDWVSFHRVEPADLNVYILRWRRILEHLEAHPEISEAWCCDGTDVALINDPPSIRPNTLYTGYEPTVVGCEWMVKSHPAHVGWIERNKDRTLLNAGVAGGTRGVLMEFCQLVLNEWAKIDQVSGMVGDMSTFNLVAYEDFGGRLVAGPRIVTLFKRNERNTWSAFQHK